MLGQEVIVIKLHIGWSAARSFARLRARCRRELRDVGPNALALEGIGGSIQHSHGLVTHAAVFPAIQCCRRESHAPDPFNVLKIEVTIGRMRRRIAFSYTVLALLSPSDANRGTFLAIWAAWICSVGVLFTWKAKR